MGAELSGNGQGMYETKCPHCGGAVPAPGFFAARKHGLARLVADLLGCDVSGPDDVRRNVEFVKLLGECGALAPGADVFLRAPLDRLQQLRSLSAGGIRKGQQYAVTIDVDVDASVDAKLGAVAHVLSSLLAMLKEENHDAALKPGCDPVPSFQVWR